MQLTEEQTAANHFIWKFVHSRDSTVCLEGFAGTGKTTVVGAFLQDCYDTSLSICVAAPTHKALDVLREKCRLAKVEFRTTASLVGLMMRRDSEGKKTFVQRPMLTPPTYDLVIVDECSMVGERSFRYLENRFEKILFVGDPAQIPPVGEKSGSPTFGVPLRFRMENVVRQAADNPIIKVSMMIRQKMIHSGSVSLTDLRATLNDDNRASIISRDDLHRFAVDAIKFGLVAPILAYRNQDVDYHNSTLHKELYPDAPLFGDGERAIVDETFFQGDDIYPTLIGSERVKVLQCRPHEPIAGVEAYRVSIERDDKTVLNVFVAADVARLKAVQEQVGKRIGDLLRRRESLPRYLDEKVAATRENRLPMDEKEFTDRVEAAKTSIDNQLASELATNAKLDAFVLLRHAYSCTVHKSQGSTFDVALLDWWSIDRAKDARLLYTAVTRPAQYLVVAA